MVSDDEVLQNATAVRDELRFQIGQQINTADGVDRKATVLLTVGSGA